MLKRAASTLISALVLVVSGTKDIGLLFFVAVLCSRYSKLKLGRDSDKPEFSDVTYFTMLFACGEY